LNPSEGREKALSDKSMPVIVKRGRRAREAGKKKKGKNLSSGVLLRGERGKRGELNLGKREEGNNLTKRTVLLIEGGKKSSWRRGKDGDNGEKNLFKQDGAKRP